MARRSLFIVNPAAGGGRAGHFWQRIRRDLVARDASPTAVLTTRVGEATMLAREAASSYECVTAVGGDGTVSEVAEGLLATAQCPCALGIIPLGTGNDFAWMMGIRHSQDGLRALATNECRVIDVIEVHCDANGIPAHRHALFFAGAGIIGPLLRKTTRWTKRLLGRAWAYRAGLLRALGSYRSPGMRIICDEAVWEGTCLFLGVSNGEYVGGGMRIAPGARMDDGSLNVNLVGPVGRWEALKQFRRLARGEHTAHSQVRYFSASTISIESEPVSEVATDGEIIGNTPAKFVVKPKALRVLGRS